MKKRGRPCKITPELTERVVDLIKQGLTQKDACNLAGLAYSTYNEWKAKGDKGIQPFAEFFSVTSRARNEHKAYLLKIVQAGATGMLPRFADWKAASWLLSKGWPLQYGDRIAVETDPIPVSPMPPLTLLFSMPNGKKQKTTFKEAQEILCAGFPIRDEPPDESELGKEADDLGNGLRFHQ
jgi:transposase